MIKPEPEQIWAETLQHLQQQMTQAIYSRITQSVRLLRADDHHYLIGVDNQSAKDWLEHRLHDTIQRTLSRVAGQPVQLEFRLLQ